MTKNIIVCADGTGNRGGYSPDSNVYKVYKAVEKNIFAEDADGNVVAEQIVFYDNGVGTSKNKYLRSLGGAFGFGFEDNVCDLYKFLARNYCDGDKIYIFGFSRGASTVRACNGMISKCGLAKGEGLRNRELDERVKEAFCAYKKHNKKPSIARDLKSSDRSHGAVEIKFMGIWDTVVALGFPKRTDMTGPVTLVLNGLFYILENLLNILWSHDFYYYKLTDNVSYACHALAIDDERTAFWPFVWREKGVEGTKDRTRDNVEQVWFAGMHSNVGGGYERAGMANIPLYWVLCRAEKHGLKLEKGALDEIYNTGHVHGRMYNSRDGFAFFYRYHPREIENLCENRLLGEIKIHCSVIERMLHRTANYAPGFIPEKFEVADSRLPEKDQAVPERLCNPGADENWNNVRKKINKVVLLRKRLYGAMLTAVITVLFFIYYYWANPPQLRGHDGFFGSIAETLKGLLPDLFSGLIEMAVAQKPVYFLVFVILVIAYYGLRGHLHRKTVRLCETLRHFIITK